MTKHKALLLFGLTGIFIFGSSAQSDCNSKKNKNAAINTNPNQNIMSVNKKSVETPMPNLDGEVKTLAEGSYGEMEKPFLFVARSAETFKQLQSAFKELPPLSGIDFEKQAVIAAFAGAKNTGGYSVEIKNTGGKVSVSVKNPPPDAMVTEALTMPYQVAVVSFNAEKSLDLDVSADWKNAAQTFKLVYGEFEYSGGITGRLKRFAAEGTVNIWQFGDLATFDFNLAGIGADSNMQLSEIASGIAKGGQVNLTRLNAGSFSEGPKPPLKVSGTISGDRLSLIFEPLPTMISDGFRANGKLEAISTK